MNWVLYFLISTPIGYITWAVVNFNIHRVNPSEDKAPLKYLCLFIGLLAAPIWLITALLYSLTLPTLRRGWQWKLRLI